MVLSELVGNSRCSIAVLKGAQEHQLKPDVIGAMGVVGPSWWPVVLGSQIASEEQLGASGQAYSDQHSAMGVSESV